MQQGVCANFCLITNNQRLACPLLKIQVQPPRQTDKLHTAHFHQKCTRSPTPKSFVILTRHTTTTTQANMPVRRPHSPACSGTQTEMRRMHLVLTALCERYPVTCSIPGACLSSTARQAHTKHTHPELTPLCVVRGDKTLDCLLRQDSSKVAAAGAYQHTPQPAMTSKQTPPPASTLQRRTQAANTEPGGTGQTTPHTLVVLAVCTAHRSCVCVHNPMHCTPPTQMQTTWHVQRHASNARGTHPPHQHTAHSQSCARCVICVVW